MSRTVLVVVSDFCIVQRENRRKSSVVSSMIESTPTHSGSGRGRPKEDREIKKRVSLSVMPSLYGDIQKIAYVQRRSTSDLIGDLMEQFRAAHREELAEYEKIKKSEKNG